jgi:hypothetical protein
VFRCHVSGATQAKQEFTTDSRETTERIRRMLHGEAKPVRAEVLEVLHMRKILHFDAQIELYTSHSYSATSP